MKRQHDVIVGFLLTCTTFFYLGWWLQHEEDLGYGPTHTHPGADYYHVGAAAFGAVWILVALLRYAPRVHLGFTVPLIAAFSFLCFTRLPYNPDGIDAATTVPISLGTVVATTAVTVCVYGRTPITQQRRHVALRAIARLHLLVNATFSFYMAWWLAHEVEADIIGRNDGDDHHDHHDHHHEEEHNLQHTPPHRENRSTWETHLLQLHPEARYFWIGAMPLTLVWLLGVVRLYAPLYFYERPIPLTALVCNVLVLCAISLPFNPSGVDRFGVLAFSITTAFLVLATAPRVLWIVRTQRVDLPRPRTLETIRDCAERRMMPVANAWSFWLKYESVRGDAFALGPSNWSGVQVLPGKDRIRVRSGTTFREVRRVLTGMGMTMWDRCQFDDVTVGGAIATHSHGMNARYSFMDDVVVHVEVIRRGTRDVVTLGARAVSSDHIIVHATLRIVPDRPMTVTRCNVARDEFPLSRWNVAMLRTVWINSRSCVVMTAGEGCGATVSSARRFPRCENMSLLLGGTEDSVQTIALSATHSMFETMFPIEMICMRLLQYRNASIFIDNEISILSLVSHLCAFHKRVGGNAYIRRTGRRTTVDVALTRRRDMRELHTILREVGAARISYHPGKWIPSPQDTLGAR